MRFVIKATALKEFVDLQTAIVDDARWKANGEGITVRAVDPAHISMVDAQLSAAAFGTFEPGLEDIEIGIDLDKALEVLNLAASDADISAEINEGKAILKIANTTRRMNLVDTAEMSWPKIPNPDLPAAYSASVSEMKKFCKGATNLADYLILQGDVASLRLRAENDLDDLETVLTKGDGLIDFAGPKDGGKVQSLFPLDYFSRMLSKVRAEYVAIRIGQDYPMMLEFDLASKGKGMFMLAPRIEEPD